MMRWIILGVAVVVLAAAGTLAVQLVPISASPGGDEPAFPAAPANAGKVGPLPAVVVDEELIRQVGTVAQQTVGRLTWTIRNEGAADLHLREGEKTCSCSIIKLLENKVVAVKPGDQFEFEFEYQTREFSNHHVWSISILTDDPNRPSIPLRIEGNVQQPVVMFPPGGAINFMSVSNDELHPAKVAIGSPDHPQMKILEVVSSNPAHVTAEAKLLDAEELKSVNANLTAPSPGTGPSHATTTLLTSGYRIEVALKVGMPLGAFHEEVVIKTDHPLRPETKISVAGTMVGPISVSPERVRMLQVVGGRETRSDVTLWVRGKSDTTFEVLASPEKLKVAIAPIDNTLKGAGRFRMTVTVPADAPAGKIEGDIVLKTNHPQAGEVKIPVNVFVRKG